MSLGRRAARVSLLRVMELHERFEAYERSTEASAARTAAHDDVKVLFAALARNAGAIAVAMEPRGWDAGGATDRHKRPDIEWINVETRLFTVSDVAIRWAMTAGSGTEHAAAAEKNKVTDYKPAMKRNREAAARARRPRPWQGKGYARAAHERQVLATWRGM